MFFLLLPAGIWLGTLVPSIIISTFHEDDRNVGGACIVVFLAPVALICLIRALWIGATWENGDAAFLSGLAWNLLLVVAMSAVFFVLTR